MPFCVNIYVCIVHTYNTVSLFLHFAPQFGPGLVEQVSIYICMYPSASHIPILSLCQNSRARTGVPERPSQKSHSREAFSGKPCQNSRLRTCISRQSCTRSFRVVVMLYIDMHDILSISKVLNNIAHSNSWRTHEQAYRYINDIHSEFGLMPYRVIKKPIATLPIKKGAQRALKKKPKEAA